VSGPKPFVFEDTGQQKRFAPATLRNRDAIADILHSILPPTGKILEVASGTGEHIVYFAGLFPHLTWQPSDPDSAALASIEAWRAEAGHSNVLQPVKLDAATDNWQVLHADAILCINMIHIAPWEAAVGLMDGAGKRLPSGAPIYLYGPFREKGVPLAESNASFDQSLKSRNPQWGLRKVENVVDLANANSLVLESRIEMPANNLSLIFRKA